MTLSFLCVVLLFCATRAEWKSVKLDDGRTLNYSLPLRIATVIEAPFVMYKKDADTLSGNDRFNGYIIDLLEEMKRVSSIDFTYEIQLSVDGQYGGKNEDGTWNGMVGMLMRGEADIAAGPITKSYERATVVDFSTAFMHSGITILFKRDTTERTPFLQFLTPFTSTVWLFMLGGFLLVITQLWVLSRVTPKETKNKELTLAESIWATVAALMGQATQWSPKALSTRILLAAWWLFVLVLVACYTANLAAFLSVARAKVSFTNVIELAAQTQIKYGAGRGSSTETFFMESKIEVYQEMWRYMKSNPNVLSKDTEDMLARVHKGNYAALSDSTVLEYLVNKDCGLKVVGGLISSDGFGFAFQKGSLLERAVTREILYLSDNSFLIWLKNKWWSGPENCDPAPTDDLDSLGFPAFVGIFAVLLAGVVLADVAGLLEWVMNRRKRKVKDVEQAKTKETLQREMKKKRSASAPTSRGKQHRKTSEKKGNV